MSVVAYEGPAGSGKTYALIHRLQDELASSNLSEHQKVLALTFMHGSRRRLDARLKEIPTLKNRFEATTVDSFAWHVCLRWRDLASALGQSVPAEDNYDQTCRLAAMLLEDAYVRAWVSTSFPIIIVDEAQDLSVERTAIVAALSKSSLVLLAYDEFQCLDEARLPIALLEWLPDVCCPIQLTTIHRTNVTGLLTAAGATRTGRALVSGRDFRFMPTPSRGKRPSLAAACLAGIIIGRVRNQSLAVLAPTRPGFANDVIQLIQAGPVGKKKLGPFPVQWEESECEELDGINRAHAMPDRCTAEEAIAVLNTLKAYPAARSTKAWVERQRRLTGTISFAKEQILSQLARSVSHHRHYGHRASQQYAAMTIHQAKNREFDHVVVLWPYAVAGNDEQKRRLLYNAITRARFSCSILVQHDSLLGKPPFVPESRSF